MKRHHDILGLSALLLGLFAAVPAHAEGTEGAIQLALGTPIVTYSSSTTTIEEDPIEIETDVSRTVWGLGNEVAGELGYGLTDSLVLGAFVQLGGTSQTTEFENGDEGESSSFRFFLGPKVDYMFSPNSSVRPFVGGIVGLGVNSSESGDIETSLTSFQLQARAGLRGFVTNSFSIDPAFVFGWSTGSGEIDAGLAQTDISASGITVGLTLALSGWVP